MCADDSLTWPQSRDLQLLRTTRLGRSSFATLCPGGPLLPRRRLRVDCGSSRFRTSCLKPAVPVWIRQAKVAAMRAHAAARRPCLDLRDSTAEQPGNRGLKRFQYPVVVRGSNPVEIEETDSKVLEVLTPESEHWRGLQLDPNHRLLIRRSLVRAQVGEPRMAGVSR